MPSQISVLSCALCVTCRPLGGGRVQAPRPVALTAASKVTSCLTGVWFRLVRSPSFLQIRLKKLNFFSMDTPHDVLKSMLFNVYFGLE